MLGAALGSLLEYTLQLAVNTLSFARVGAFALAHAGLSLAVVDLAVEAVHPFMHRVVRLLGHVVIIIVEGIVVAGKGTPLVLCEFFIRFLRGEGRRFSPLAPPGHS